MDTIVKTNITDISLRQFVGNAAWLVVIVLGSVWSIRTLTIDAKTILYSVAVAVALFSIDFASRYVGQRERQSGHSVPLISMLGGWLRMSAIAGIVVVILSFRPDVFGWAKEAAWPIVGLLIYATMILAVRIAGSFRSPSKMTRPL